MDEIKLKPCPFCGGEPKLVFEERSFDYAPDLNFVRCTECGSRGKVYHSNLIDEAGSGYSAIKAWNRRANDG